MANSEYNRSYYNKNREKLRSQNREYTLKNKDKIKNKQKERYENKKEEIKEQVKRYYHANKESNRSKKNEWHKLYYKSNKGMTKYYKKYGITVEEYNRIFKEQNACCAGCKKHQSEFNKKLSVDHCHITGKIRGLLCVNCNFVLGNAHDNINTLLSLIDYLKKN